MIVWSEWSAVAGNVKVTLKATTTLAQTGHEGLGDDVVHPDHGHFDLSLLLNAPDDFHHEVKIDIALQSHMVDAHGHALHACWARPDEGPVPAQPGAEHGCCWFVAKCGDTTPITVPHVRASDHLLRIDDDRPIGGAM